MKLKVKHQEAKTRASSVEVALGMAGGLVESDHVRHDALPLRVRRPRPLPGGDGGARRQLLLRRAERASAYRRGSESVPGSASPTPLDCRRRSARAGRAGAP